LPARFGLFSTDRERPHLFPLTHLFPTGVDAALPMPPVAAPFWSHQLMLT
jgi:hypothetical protein